MKKLLFVILALCVCFAGCATDTITLPRPEPVRVSRDAHTGNPIVVSNEYVREYIGTMFGEMGYEELPQIKLQDRQYAVVSHKSMVKYADSIQRLRFALGKPYRGEYRDCDDFANLMVSLASFVGETESDVRSSMLVGTFEVWQKNTFARVEGRPNLKHALVWFYSSNGIHVMEPQVDVKTGIIKLRDYPNKEWIIYISD